MKFGRDRISEKNKAKKGGNLKGKRKEKKRSLMRRARGETSRARARE